jgi:hypothetical protein
MLAVPVPGIIDQVPPGVASVNAGVVAPGHTVAAPPAIGATEVPAFMTTVAVVVLVQALAFVNV